MDWSLEPLRRAGLAFWMRAAAWSVAIGLAIGMPTVLIDNSLFKRMTPTSAWQYVAWAIAALLAGHVMATRSLPRPNCSVEGRTLVGGGLAYLAVGCPICNKIVVSLVGVSGALNYFAPLQPLLALLSLGVLIATLRTILRRANSETSQIGPQSSIKAPECSGSVWGCKRGEIRHMSQALSVSEGHRVRRGGV